MLRRVPLSSARGPRPVRVARWTRRAAWVLGAGMAIAVLPGCAGASSSQVNLYVVDMALRADGAECAGTGAWQQFHAGVAYQITDADSRVIARGTLPAGVAKPALDTDFGAAVRIPTVCAMDLQIDGGADAAWLVVSSQAPVPLVAAEQPGTWTAVVPQGASAVSGESTEGDS